MPAISRWIARQSTTSVVPPIPDSRCGAVPPEDRRHAYRIAGHLAGGYERELARRASFAALYDIGDRRFQLQVATSRCSPSAETSGIAPGAKVGLASPVPARP